MKRFFAPLVQPFWVAVAILIWGCGPASVPFDAHVPAQTWSPVGAPPIDDARFRFRAIFCALWAANQHRLPEHSPCGECLWRLSDEPPAAAEPVHLPEHDPRMTILIVPGAFSECFQEVGAPFQEGAEHLRQIGYRIQTVPAGGLSSSPANAAIIAEAVAGLETPPTQRVVLMGYSKGTTDILHFLVAHPDLAARVSAVVSIAGAVNGSPLADRYSASDYDNWIAGIFPGDCSAGDRGVLDSLSRIRQFQWLVTHPLPEHVRYFSLAAFAQYSDVQLPLRPTYTLLARIHPLNDGQLLFLDQLIPGSTLMGYLNADHWTVAIPAEEKFSGRGSALRERNRLRRKVVFEAAVRFVAESLNASR